MLKPSLIQHNVGTCSQSVFDKTTLLILRGGDSQLPPVIPPSKFEPFIEKFTPGHEQHANIAAAIILATLLKPTAKIYFEQFSTMMRSRISKITKQHEDDGGVATIETFEMSKFHQVVKTIVEAARLYLAVAVFDVCKTIISCIGIKLPKGDVLTVIFGWGIYLMWGFRRLSGLKFYFLKNIMINTAIIDDPRRLHFINRISDYGLMLFGFFLFYEILNFELGYGGKTILTTLSFGTAAVALATKDIITNFLNGIILSASDRIYEGDFISIQGDIKKVNRLGWLETRLRSSDNKLYTVSNTELVSTKLSNLSRINTCQGTYVQRVIACFVFVAI